MTKTTTVIIIICIEKKSWWYQIQKGSTSSMLYARKHL